MDAVRVARTVEMIPPPAARMSRYAAPAIFISNSSARSPRPNDMCVRIHKARHEDAIARVESRFVRIGDFEFSRRADRNDLLIAHHDRAVFDDAKRAESFAPLRSVGECEELGGGVDEHFW